MNIDRRSFLGSVLALAAAPAIVRASSLMPIVPVGRYLRFDSGARLVMPGDRLNVTFNGGGKQETHSFLIRRTACLSGMQQDPRTGLWLPT